jgi:hypothetical protein
LNESNVEKHLEIGQMNEIKLPRDVQFLEDLRLIVYRPRGLLSKAAVDEILVVLERLEFSLSEPFDRFTDTLEADDVELNAQYVIQISLYRRFAYTGHPPVKSAILATDSTMIHYARLHALLTQGSPLDVRVFQDRKKAAQWLGVPIERLTAEDAGRDKPA